MTATNLFGEAPEQQPQKFPISYIGTKNQRQCTSEEKSILTSALIKYMRLGDIDKCIEIFWKMQITGVPQSYMVRRICAFTWEDAVGGEILVWGNALHDTWQHDSDNAIMRTIIACCKAPKFWDWEWPNKVYSDIRNEHELEVARIRIREEVKQKAQEGIVIDDFPYWCHDHYTIQGRYLGATKLDHPNNRYSGILQGGLNMRAETIAYGRTDPTKPSLFHMPEVVEATQKRMSMDAYLREKGMSNDDFIEAALIYGANLQSNV